MSRELLLGRWVLAEDDFVSFQRHGAHAFDFSRHGDLVHTVTLEGMPARIVLTWRLDGEVLVTDHPSSPAEERHAVSLGPGGVLHLGHSRYERDRAAVPFDPDSHIFAFGGAALRHALASVGESAFAPFLMLDDDHQLDFVRVAAASPEAAEVEARRRARAAPHLVRWSAWAWDGEVAVGDEHSDAVFATVSERGHAKARTFFLRYHLERGRAQPYGSMGVAAEPESWL